MSVALQEHSEILAAQQEVQVCCVSVYLDLSQAHIVIEALRCQAGAFPTC